MTSSLRERIREIDNAVSVELRALNLLDAKRLCVFLLVCMSCGAPYSAHLVSAGDSARIACSHGICDGCEADRDEAQRRYDERHWERPE